MSLSTLLLLPSQSITGPSLEGRASSCPLVTLLTTSFPFFFFYCRCIPPGASLSKHNNNNKTFTTTTTSITNPTLAALLKKTSTTMSTTFLDSLSLASAIPLSAAHLELGKPTADATALQPKDPPVLPSPADANAVVTHHRRSLHIWIRCPLFWMARHLPVSAYSVSQPLWVIGPNPFSLSSKSKSFFEVPSYLLRAFFLSSSAPALSARLLLFVFFSFLFCPLFASPIGGSTALASPFLCPPFALILHGATRAVLRGRASSCPLVSPSPSPALPGSLILCPPAHNGVDRIGALQSVPILIPPFAFIPHGTTRAVLSCYSQLSGLCLPTSFSAPPFLAAYTGPPTSILKPF